jgi:SAM-dependent methyltransferase
MAVAEDFWFLQRVRAANHVKGRCLEIGSLNHQGGPHGNCKFTIESWGLEYEGADLEPGPGVDHVVDFTSSEAVRRVFGNRTFDTLLLFNVLEHVYEPLRFLDQALRLLAPGGAFIVSTPLVWELHDFPKDFWRPNPNLYEEYARRNRLQIIDGLFVYLYQGKIRRLRDFDAGTQHRLPSFNVGAFAHGGRRYWYSKIVHRLFNTLGRSHPFMYTALGCVMLKPDGPRRSSDQPGDSTGATRD